MSIYVERSGHGWEARYWHRDEQRYFRFRADSPSEAVRKAVRGTGYTVGECRIIRT